MMSLRELVALTKHHDGVARLGNSSEIKRPKDGASIPLALSGRTFLSAIQGTINIA